MTDSIEIKTITDFSLVADFFKAVISGAPDAKKKKIKAHDAAWYEAQLKQGDFAVGAYDGDKLVGTCFVNFETSKDLHAQSARDFVAEKYGVDTPIAALRNGVLLPEYRGQGIGQQAGAYIDQKVKENGVDIVYAASLATNVPSLSVAFKNGFTVSGVGASEVDSAPQLCFLTKDLSKQLKFKEKVELIFSLRAQTMISKHLSEGWVGTELKAFPGAEDQPDLVMRLP